MKSFNIAPFIRLDSDKFPKYYTDFLIALAGPLFMAVFLYGFRAALIIAFCLVTAVFLNALEFSVFSSKPIIDPNDILTAVILPLLCPATINLLIPCSGVAVAVVIRILISNLIKPKMMFISSACVGWVFLVVTFGSRMFEYTAPQALTSFSLSVTSVGEAVPSVAAILKTGNGEGFRLIDLLLGELAGPMGASSPIVLISCALFLMIRHSAPYQTFVGYILSAFICSVAFGNITGCTLLTAGLFSVSGGSLLFCSIFIACQRHFYPMTKTGRWISGILLGFFSILLRLILPLEQAAPIAILVITFLSYYIDVVSYLLNNAVRYAKVLYRNRLKERVNALHNKDRQAEDLEDLL
ncbi:MAG: RnfABCDGE type electron transport complex subunit D [Clostridia bacterium]|nr:RnfABCDGE type electron transport complex subunit D [Clostridia bacterium]